MTNLCERQCVTKLCVKDGVQHRCVCVTKMMCDKIVCVCVCDKVVCERQFVTELCVKDMTKMVCDKDVCVCER